MAKMPEETVGKDKALYLAALRTRSDVFGDRQDGPEGRGRGARGVSEGSPEVAKANIDVSKTFTNKYVDQVKKTTGMNAKYAGMTLPRIHRVTTLDLKFEPSDWPFAQQRRAEIDAHSRSSRPRSLLSGTAACCSAAIRSSPASGSRPVFRDRFRELFWPGAIGVPGQQCVQRLRHGRAALRRRRLRDGRDGRAYRQCRTDLFSVRDARPGRYQGRHRPISPAAWSARSARKPELTSADYQWARIGIAWSWAVDRDDAAIACRDLGRGDAGAIEANLARQAEPELAAIHLVRGLGDLTAAMPRFVTAFVEKHWSLS